MENARFDLAVYDNDIPGAIQLTGRKVSAKVPKMVFAIMPSATAAEMQGKRIHFVVQKPIPADLFGRTLRPAFGIMLKERRPAFRHLVRIVPTSCFSIHSDRRHAYAPTTVLPII